MTAESGLILYGYWRSSAAYRVRIALNLKGLSYVQHAVHLIRDGGEQHAPAYRRLNPQGLVPALAHDGAIITQSLAICEYLDERFPAHPLLPSEPLDRARCRAMALAVACDIHPINNLRVQQYLERRLDVPRDDVVAWMNHWVAEGFAAIEAELDARGGPPFCQGPAPGLADCFLVPQVYNAERFECDLSPFPRIRAVTARCRSLPAFAAAEPERQPDAPAR